MTASKKGALPAATDEMIDSDTVLECMDVESQMGNSIPNNNNATEKKERSGSLSDEDEDQQVLACDFDDNNQKVYVPLPGQTLAQNAAKEGATSSKRLVSSGCAVCLCLFDPEEKITWSANPECPHIFHSDCVLHWFLAVGRKTQSRRLRRNPDMSQDEIIGKICEFARACPCCRQDFCREVGFVDPPPSTATTRSTDEMDSEDEEVEQNNAIDNMQTATGSEAEDIESGHAENNNQVAADLVAQAS
jgi:hypothetical protein